MRCGCGNGNFMRIIKRFFRIQIGERNLCEKLMEKKEKCCCKINFAKRPINKEIYFCLIKTARFNQPKHPCFLLICIFRDFNSFRSFVLPQTRRNFFIVLIATRRWIIDFRLLWVCELRLWVRWDQHLVQNSAVSFLVEIVVSSILSR